MINLSAIRLFVRIIEHGRIAPAAREFGLAPSVASRQIAALEHAFDTKLLVRTTRHLSLTPTGAIFLEWARATTGSLDALHDELGAMQNQPTGTIRLSSNDYAATALLPPILAEFCTVYPGIRIQMITSNDPTALLKEECEIALHAGRPPEADFICRRVLTYHRYLCASPAYLATRPMPRVIADLAAHQCLTHTHDERAAWSFDQDGAIVTQTIRPFIECDNFLSIIELVQAGVGIARLADTLVEPAMQAGKLVRILPTLRCVYPDGEVPGTWLLFANRRILFRTRLLADFIARSMARSRRAEAGEEGRDAVIDG